MSGEFCCKFLRLTSPYRHASRKAGSYMPPPIASLPPCRLTAKTGSRFTSTEHPRSVMRECGFARKIKRLRRKRLFTRQAAQLLRIGASACGRVIEVTAVVRKSVFSQRGEGARSFYGYQLRRSANFFCQDTPFRFAEFYLFVRKALILSLAFCLMFM